MKRKLSYEENEEISKQYRNELTMKKAEIKLTGQKKRRLVGREREILM